MQQQQMVNNKITLITKTTTISKVIFAKIAIIIIIIPDTQTNKQQETHQHSRLSLSYNKSNLHHDTAINNSCQSDNNNDNGNKNKWQ